MAHLTLQRGYVALDGPPVAEAAGPGTSTMPFHTTLLTKRELDEAGVDAAALIADPTIDLRLMDLGRGGGNGVYFKVIEWPGGAAVRQRYGLAPKQFHITLTETDDHTTPLTRLLEFAGLSDADLDIVLRARRPGGSSKALLALPYVHQPSERLFQALCGPTDTAFMHQATTTYPGFCSPLLKLGCYYLKQHTNKKLAMVYLLLVHVHAPHAQAVAALDGLLQRASKQTIWGPLPTDAEAAALPEAQLACMRELAALPPPMLHIDLAEGSPQAAAGVGVGISGC